MIDMSDGAHVHVRFRAHICAQKTTSPRQTHVLDSSRQHFGVTNVSSIGLYFDKWY
jgi:hypothetical protein